MTDFVVVIPARYTSTRLPGKPLRDINGKPMLQHVYDRGTESGASEVIVATDDERIADAAEGFDPQRLQRGGFAANLGGLLMRMALPYHSDRSRAIAGCLTSLLTAEAYAQSARLAAEKGVFPRYEANREAMARVVRGQVLALRRSEFVQAAQLIGVGTFGIIRRHIAPNLVGIVVVYLTLTIPQAILVESFLSFLGLGVQEPQTSLGSLVNGGVAQMEAAPWLLLIPAALLALILMAFNFLGDGLRDYFDARKSS